MRFISILSAVLFGMAIFCLSPAAAQVNKSATAGLLPEVQQVTGLAMGVYAKPVNRSLASDWTSQENLMPDISEINGDKLINDAGDNAGLTVGREGYLTMFSPVLHEFTGTALCLGDVALKATEITLVGSGRADPTMLENIIPSTVMAWKALRGPENVPFQDRTIKINETRNDGFWTTVTSGTEYITKTFSTTRAGFLGKWGFDPATDTIGYTRTESLTSRTFNTNSIGSRYQAMTSPTIKTPVIKSSDFAKSQISASTYNWPKITPPSWNSTGSGISTASSTYIKPYTSTHGWTSASSHISTPVWNSASSQINSSAWNSASSQINSSAWNSASSQINSSASQIDTPVQTYTPPSYSSSSISTSSPSYPSSSISRSSRLSTP